MFVTESVPSKFHIIVQSSQLLGVSSFNRSWLLVAEPMLGGGVVHKPLWESDES